MLRKVLLGSTVVVTVLAMQVAGSAEDIPPPRPPKVKLSCRGKEVYEGRRVIYDEDSYPREPGKLVEGPTVKREGENVRISFTTEAELWAHLGVSQVLGHCGCPMTSNKVAVDEADRIFAADTQQYHVKVLDTAGNLIARVGAWGNRDCAGPKSKYPKPEIAFDLVHSLDALGDSLYVSDRYLRRVVKVRMDYREVREAAVP